MSSGLSDNYSELRIYMYGSYVVNNPCSEIQLDW